MSNSTTSTKVIDIARAIQVILIMDRYMLITIYITGMIGAILNIITFRQKQIRRNSCSIYFLATSVVDFCIMNIFILMEILVTYNPILSTLIYSTRIWCKVGNYLMLLFPCLSSSYITLASFDRFCASSLNPAVRKWSNLKINRIIVISVFIIWVLFGSHILIAYDYNKDPVSQLTLCRVVIGSPTLFLIIDGFFFSLFNGAIVPFLLCIFGLMIFYNMTQSRRRIQIQPPTRSNRTTTISIIPVIIRIQSIQNQNSIHMLRMLLVQVSLTIILNIPYVVIYLFNFFHRPSTDLLLFLLYIIFAFISRWFYYMNYCKTFYINTLTSRLFRKSLQQQFVQFFHRRQRL